MDIRRGRPKKRSDFHIQNPMHLKEGMRIWVRNQAFLNQSHQMRVIKKPWQNESGGWRIIISPFTSNAESEMSLHELGVVPIASGGLLCRSFWNHECWIEHA